MDGKLLDALKRYGVAVALAGLALFLRSVLPFPEGTYIHQLPIAAVVLSAWYGGRGPGWLASLVCVTGASYLFVPPVHSFQVAPDHVLPLAIFVTLCLLLTEFSAGRRRAEHALRASEERFRTLVQFSFDAYWYWETDAQHRFTRQEFAQFLTDAPPPNPSIGKTRWEVPYLEPDEEGWRKHRAMLDAHLLFRDFELARPGADGRKRYMAVSGMPVFDGSGRFVGYRGVGRDITERKRAEDEHRQHLRFLETMDRVNRAIQGTGNLEQMMNDVLDAVLSIFECDRAVLGRHRERPDTTSFTLLAKRERPGFALDLDPGVELAADEGLSAMSAELKAAGGPVQWVLGSLPPAHARVLAAFDVQSVLSMPIEPKIERRDWMFVFTLRQCTYPRVWTSEEMRLFQEIGRRFGDAVMMLSTLRDLRQSESRLEAAQALARVGWWERDYATGRVSLSDEACRIFGVQPLDLRQWHGRWVSLIHPDDRLKTAEASEIALGGGPRYDVEYRVVRPDGRVRVVHSQGDITRDESGRTIRQFGVMQDITELRRAEGEVRASEARFRTFVDHAMDAFFLLDEKLTLVDVNRQACESLGWSREELIGMHPRDFDVGLDEASIDRLAQRADAGEIINFETRHRRRDGTTFPVEIRTGTVEQGGRRFYLALARDITQRKLAEESLRQSEAYLTEAQRLSHTGSWALDVASNRYLYTSEEFDRIFGFDPQGETPTREAVLERMHPEDRSSWNRILEKSVREKLDTTSQYRIVLPDGKVRHVHTIRRPVMNSAGEVVKLVGTSIDITERKRAEDKLRENEAYLAEAQRLSHTGSWALDVASMRYVYTSEESDRLFGFDPQGEKPTREAVFERIHPEDRESWKQNLEKSLREKVDTFDHYRVVLPDGRVRHIHTIRHPVVNDSGLVVKLVGTSIDITERKRAEEEREKLRLLEAELAHANRVKALGELTTSIVHEVSQPLGAMIASAAAGARWLAAEPPDMAEARAALDNIAADGKRAREVITRIRSLMKRQAARVELLDVNRKIHEVLALTEHELRGHQIALRTELDTVLPRVAGDRVQVQQVILNLILNAMEAMSGVQDRPRELTIVSQRDGKAVLVEVRDSGTGLGGENAEAVFEAFYTTKSAGIGIGLSISRSIVEAHGGRLRASPNEPHGAVFRLSLPIAKEGQS